MGNCLRSQVKIVQIEKPDGKILEYKASIKVSDVLSEYQGHGLSDKLPVLQYLKPNFELVAGHLYHLVPFPVPTQSPKVRKKKVTFAEPEKVKERESKAKSLTVKLVISKQQLKEMLESGVVSLDELVSKHRNDKSGTEKLNEQNCGSMQEEEKYM